MHLHGVTVLSHPLGEGRHKTVAYYGIFDNHPLNVKNITCYASQIPVLQLEGNFIYANVGLTIINTFFAILKNTMRVSGYYLFNIKDIISHKCIPAKIEFASKGIYT